MMFFSRMKLEYVYICIEIELTVFNFRSEFSSFNFWHASRAQFCRWEPIGLAIWWTMNRILIRHLFRIEIDMPVDFPWFISFSKNWISDFKEKIYFFSYIIKYYWLSIFLFCFKLFSLIIRIFSNLIKNISLDN